MKKNRIVLLDFCETVVDYQSFNPYLYYVLSRERPVIFKIMNSNIVKIFYQILEKIYYILKIEKYPLKKRLIMETKGIPYDNMLHRAQEYYNNTVSKHFIKNVTDLIDPWKKQGLQIILLSAACDLYLKYFAQEFGIEDIIATSLEFKDGYSVGCLKGVDIIGQNKVKALEKHMGDSMKETEFVLGVSDSVSDLPMLNLCKKKIVVSHGEHQSWVGDMEEIIWT